MRGNLLILLLCLLAFGGKAQSAFINGKITDQSSNPLVGANVLTNQGAGTSTDQSGRFVLTVQSGTPITLTISFLGYQTITRTFQLAPFENILLDLRMVPETRVLPGVEIQDNLQRGPALPGVTRINPEAARLLPSPFGDFNKVLATLPGVASNNELSSTYSVRGGNFDENLVYVNDIPIYRPFLIRAGQQEGLSFVNPNLVDKIEFSAGGWAPKYGDKLSSNLNIQYKQPKQWGGSLTIGFLGGSAHLEGVSDNQRVTYLVGVRHKSSEYLLNTLETDGEYLPKFTDVQSFITYQLDKERRTELGVLLSYANNRYQVEPETRETQFGTFDQSFKFLVGFDGQEILRYQTVQGGLSLKHQFSDRWHSQLITSALFTQEREYFEIEGAYRLCDADSNPGSGNFNECAVIRGLGTNYRSGRNSLDAKIFNIINHNSFQINPSHLLEFGLGYVRELIEDRLQEYEFTDSADFVTVNTPPINSTADLDSYRFTGYVQNTSSWFQHRITVGIRWQYWNLNKQWLISPRLQYAYQTLWQRPITFTAAIGWYQQAPFYRELRDFEGNLNLNLKAQSSIHAIAGVDFNFKLWNRNFKFLTEAYYKSLERVVPYDVDNVRIRYYGDNLGKAYVAGLDLRVSGAFIKGTESWFSLGILKTEEQIDGDGQGYIRRPSDQRVNLGIYFEDYMPNDPTVRVYLNLLYGSGLPFGPPNNLEFRNRFAGKSYNRLDIGFSKLISFTPKSQSKLGLKALWLNAEILNLIGARNTISYTWITDLQNRQFAVPNNLSQRFFNFKVWLEF
ncbi:MAG: TonB-dependent receptor [Cyclobacteriaceae bacterium]|nr:TonB-dependent receptor [Cyclobacteriaceae bacterium]